MRLGLHIHTRDRRDMVRRYIDEVRPPVMKWLVDGVDPDMMRYARSLGIRVVLRRVADPLYPGATGGRTLESQVLTMADQYRGTFDYVEAANEEMQGKEDPKEFDKLAELMLDFMQVCDKRGHKACVFNFSVGQPELERWTRPSMLACLDYAVKHGHAIGTHEYYRPVPWQGTEGWTTEGNANAEGWWMLRIVKALKILRARGIAIPKIIVTESGRDDISGTPGEGKGWRNDRAADFSEYMTQYCKHLRFHPEILGVVDFGAVADPKGDKRWHHFDLTAVPDVFERMIQRMRTIPLGGATVPDVTPAPAPPPTGVVYATAKSFSPRGGVRPRYIVVHSTDSPAGSTPAGTMKYLQENDRQVSIHELVIPGAVYVMVADGMAAHHAGNSTLPDGTTGSAVNAASWGTEMYQVHGEPVAPSLIDVCMARVVAACRRLDIPSRNVLGHREIDAGRRSDPVGVDMVAFRAAVAAKLGESGQPATVPPPGPDVARLIEAAKTEHARAGVRLNPGSAIQRTMLADGVWPTTNETTAEGVTYARGESAAAGAWVYWWREGRVHKVKLSA